MAGEKKKLRQTTTKRSVKDQTIKDMKILGVHKPEYNRIIDIYSDLVAQYSRISAEFEQCEYQVESSTDQGGTKKSPIVAALESLRKDILAYSDRLCLNPKALESVTVESKTRSKLEDLMRTLK